jgi:hypothetical protein
MMSIAPSFAKCTPATVQFRTNSKHVPSSIIGGIIAFHGHSLLKQKPFSVTDYQSNNMLLKIIKVAADEQSNTDEAFHLVHRDGRACSHCKT